eukprot:COSAG01_NODE_6780_length_3502_cov_3.015281_5_plen_49_part_01
MRGVHLRGRCGGSRSPRGSWAFVLPNSDPTHSMSATIDLGALTFAAGKL